MNRYDKTETQIITNYLHAINSRLARVNPLNNNNKIKKDHVMELLEEFKRIEEEGAKSE